MIGFQKDLKISKRKIFKMMEELCFDIYETGLSRCNTEKDDHNEVSFLTLINYTIGS
jgi:hypothetical protein